jgi:hypothetical protein
LTLVKSTHDNFTKILFEKKQESYEQHCKKVFLWTTVKHGKTGDVFAPRTPLRVNGSLRKEKENNNNNNNNNNNETILKMTNSFVSL